MEECKKYIQAEFPNVSEALWSVEHRDDRWNPAC